MELDIVENWEHGTLIATARRDGGGSIEFVTGMDDETVNPDSGSLRRQMHALDVLVNDDGWAVLSVSTMVTEEGQVATYLLRRPKP